jgi:hypothetical protein
MNLYIMKYKNIFYVCLFLFVLLAMPGKGQNKDSCKISVDVTADLVSSYLWRGIVSDMKPGIQPCISFDLGNFQLGAWGSSDFDDSYREVDWWLAYSFNNFTLTLNDYCWSPYLDKGKYFNWNEGSTGHFLETSLEWFGTAVIPLHLTAATFIYGPDKDWSEMDSVTPSSDLKNQYSTYFEVAYPFSIKEVEINAFLGGTPAEGFYSDKAAFTNIGFSVKKLLPLTEKFSLPVFGSLILNPQQNDVYFVFGISL